MHRAPLKSASRLVVKLGTGVLTDSRKLIDPAQLEQLVAQMAAQRKAGREIVLVTSGAVGAGMGALGYETRPTDLAEKQACAAVGQSRLMAVYDKLFSAHGLVVAQVLLTHEDLEHHERHLNARNTLVTLLHRGVVPIINENDAVSFTEIKFGDNDKLSALVAALLPADLLVILTTVDGVIENFGAANASDSNLRCDPFLQGYKMKKSFVILTSAMMFFTIGATAIAQKSATTDKRPNAKAAVDPTAASPEPVDPQLAVQLADQYFNAAQVMTADFVQVSADGRSAEGKLYVSKPGKLRFEYALPATMEIIADGVTVAIRDRKLQTQESYFLAQTPLKFLLKSDIDLAKDVKVLDVVSDTTGTIISIEDSTTFGGTSRIRLKFDIASFSLKEWEVTDPQGYVTLVTLHNVDLKSVPDRNLFRIPSDSLWPSQN